MKTDLGNMRKKPRISQKPVIKKLDQAKLQCVFWPARLPAGGIHQEN